MTYASTHKAKHKPLFAYKLVDKTQILLVILSSTITFPRPSNSNEAD